MSFVTEKVPVEFAEKEDFKKLNQFYDAYFSQWTANNDKSICILKIKSSSRIDDEDFGTYYILMSYKNHWIEVKVRIDAGDGYRNCILESLSLIDPDSLSKTPKFPFDITDIVQNLKRALPEFFRATYGAKAPISLTFINSLKVGG